jgi:hypothetical protein
MKLGDIFYVIKPYKGQVGSSTSPHDYHFIPGHKYKITRIYFNGYGIVNITSIDDITHFLPSYDDVDSMISCFVTSNKWRELQLEKIGI